MTPEASLLAVGDRFVTACHAGIKLGAEQGSGAQTVLHNLLADDAAVAIDHAFYNHRGKGEAALMDRLVADHAEVKAWGTKTILRGAAPAPGGGGIVWCLEEGHYLMGSMEGYNGQLVRLTLLPGGAISAVEISAQPTAYDMKQRHLPSAERFPREELMAEGFCLPLEVTLRLCRAWVDAIASGNAESAEASLETVAEYDLGLWDAFGTTAPELGKSVPEGQGSVINDRGAAVTAAIKRIGGGACKVEEFEVVPAKEAENAMFVRWRLRRTDGTLCGASELHMFSDSGKLQTVWQFFSPKLD